MKSILGVCAVFGLLVFAPLANAETIRLQAEDYKDGGEGVGYSATPTSVTMVLTLISIAMTTSTSRLMRR